MIPHPQELGKGGPIFAQGFRAPQQHSHASWRGVKIVHGRLAVHTLAGQGSIVNEEDIFEIRNFVRGATNQSYLQNANKMTHDALSIEFLSDPWTSVKSSISYCYASISNQTILRRAMDLCMHGRGALTLFQNSLRHAGSTTHVRSHEASATGTAPRVDVPMNPGSRATPASAVQLRDTGQNAETCFPTVCIPARGLPRTGDVLASSLKFPSAASLELCLDQCRSGPRCLDRVAL